MESMRPEEFRTESCERYMITLGVLDLPRSGWTIQLGSPSDLRPLLRREAQTRFEPGCVSDLPQSG
jgi:hypothetical protein